MRLSDERIARARVAAPLLDYIRRDSGQTYARAAKTNGGEYAGPCPFCGGRDRFRIWPDSEPPRWWCRQCDAAGDLISYVQRRTGLVFLDAVTELLGPGPDTGRPAPPPELHAPESSEPPPAAWRAQAQAFCNASVDALWSEGGTKALAFLQSHYGLNERTIEQAGLGYHAGDVYDAPREVWGLPPEPEGKGLFLPRGIVVPWEIAGQTWRLFIRRPVSDPKRRHYQVPGGSNCLYRADALASRRPALMTEAALDALAVHQAAGDLVAAVASGTTGGRRVKWIAALAAAPATLLAFDQDDGGSAPLRYWSEVLSNAVPWRPYVDDPAAMLAAGMDVRAWVEAGLTYATERRRQAA